MKNKYCKYCWPQIRKSHFLLHFEYWVEKFLFIFKPLKWIIRQGNLINIDFFWVIILEILSKMKVVEYIDEPDETQLFNRSLIFFKEAKNRGIKIKAIKFLGKYTNEFKLYYKDKKYYFEGIPLAKSQYHKIDDKIKIKKILKKNNIPVAQGEIFIKRQDALKFAKSIGYPVVVKPNFGSLSQHVTHSINSEAKLHKAIEIAKIYRPDFIIEEHIKGALFRASVIVCKHVFVCKKEPANVVGDGRLSLFELIQKKNREQKRNEPNQKNATLHKIPINEMTRYRLAKQKLNIKSVLPKGKKVFLSDKYTLAYGCDIINYDEGIHQDNSALFIQIAKILNVDLIGIDFICQDIGKSYKEQKTAILETNSLPYIDMHQYPSHGEPVPVASLVWDEVLSRLDK